MYRYVYLNIHVYMYICIYQKYTHMRFGTVTSTSWDTGGSTNPNQHHLSKFHNSSISVHIREMFCEVVVVCTHCANKAINRMKLHWFISSRSSNSQNISGFLFHFWSHPWHQRTVPTCPYCSARPATSSEIQAYRRAHCEEPGNEAGVELTVIRTMTVGTDFLW